ncbi:MAG TPA: tRNA 2-selenouridine(34) synthase MnmH, partial [Burkholderiaceae bacterium]|nr:tRNA 2-selenouridine(34) synthase MnmH [Burkholderiaceae bacterium]
IQRWHGLANSGQMELLVEELLAEHYDPAYLRSIDRNFVQFDQAQVLELDDITPAAFLTAARHLQATA